MQKMCYLVLSYIKGIFITSFVKEENDSMRFIVQGKAPERTRRIPSQSISFLSVDSRTSQAGSMKPAGTGDMSCMH